MNKFFSSLVLFFLIILSVPNILAQDNKNADTKTQDEETIKIETTLINVPIIATDKEGQYIKDLKEEDFSVYEDGKKQQIELFSSETVSLNVVVLMDMSTSNRRNSQIIKKAVKAFIENIRPEDKVKLVSFTYNINELNSFTNKKDVLNNAIDKLEVGGSTRLYDAVEYSARVIFSKVQGYKALVILTDGLDSSSYFPPEMAIKKMVETDAVVYVVKYPTTPNPTLPAYTFLPANSLVYIYDKHLNFLKELTQQAGGDVIEAPAFNALAEKMKNVAEQLRHTYFIGYSPINSLKKEGYRKIEVKLNKRKATLRYKKGYSPKIDKEQK